MAGPWEKYAAEGKSGAARGPWDKYAGDNSGFDPEAALQGFGQFGLAGYLPEATALAGKAVPDPSAGVDAKLRAQGFKITQPDFQGVTTDESRAMQKQMASESPGSYYGGGIAGVIATAPLYSRALQMAGIAKQVPQMAQLAESAPLLQKLNVYGANLGSRMVQAAKEGVVLGAIQNPNTEEGDTGFNAGKRILNAGTAGVISGAIPLAADALSAGSKLPGALAKKGAAKFLSYFGGVKPEVISEYATYADRINSAPSVEALKEVADDFTGKLSADVQAKRISLDQAKEAYKSFHTDLKDAFKVAGYEAREAVTSAKQTVKDAFTSKVQGVAQDIYDTVKQLKTDVMKGSAESYQILDESGITIPVAPIKRQITGLMNDLKIAGTEAVGDDASSAFNQLQSLRKTLDKFPKDLPATEAKKMLQQLQRSTDYARGAGTFSSEADQAYQQINAAINQGLKSKIPAYAEKMEEVASGTDLLRRVSDFGDKQTGIGLLNRIELPNQIERRAALAELGDRYGVKFIDSVNPKNLPEQQVLQGALKRQYALRPDRVAEKIEGTLASSKQSNELSAAQRGLTQAEEKLAPFKPISPNSAGQTSVQQKLAQLGKGGNIELTDMFEKLGNLTNTDFVQAMKDRNTLAAFEKGAYNGSRNTLMGAITGFLFGGIYGAGAGGAIGRAVDQWGPAVTKKILDGAIFVSKRPSIQAIQQLSIPQAAKDQMVMGLKNYIAGNAEEARKSFRGNEAWAARGIQKLGLEDPELISRVYGDPKGEQLLIRASDLSPGSPALLKIKDQIKKGWGAK